jgi:peptide subunit release factor 1 (eRF1)
MKLLTRDQIDVLSRFKSEKYLTTSFFLDSDKSQKSKKEIQVAVKNLLTIGRTKLDSLDLGKENRASLCRDLDKINEYCSQNLSSSNSQGLALFSCQGERFWQDIHLPHPPRNRIFFDRNPYLRPLSAILGTYRHIIAFLFDRREARWYEVFMGELKLLESVTSDVPSKVKEGGFEGTQAKRIERHIEAHLHDYFKKAAQTTFDLFKKNHFDWIFLGCEDKYFSDFKPFLHAYLRERLKGRLKAKPTDSCDKILKESVELENRLNKAEEDEVVRRLVAELESGGLAVSGIKETLRRLNQVEVQNLIVTHNFSAEGKICPRCKFLYLEELLCPNCQVKTERVVDVVDEAIEAALKKHAEVRHITPPSKLDRFGKIGAFLRYKV